MTESIKYTTKSINLHLTQVVPCNIPIPNCTIYSGCNIIIHQSENSSKIWQFGDNSPYINLPVTFFGEVIMIHPDIYIYIKNLFIPLYIYVILPSLQQPMLDMYLFSIPIRKIWWKPSHSEPIFGAPWPRSAGRFWSAPPEAPRDLPWFHRVACAPAPWVKPWVKTCGASAKLDQLRSITIGTWNRIYMHLNTIYILTYIYSIYIIICVYV